MDTVKTSREERAVGGKRAEKLILETKRKKTHTVGLNNFRNNPNSEFPKNKTDCTILKSTRGKKNQPNKTLQEKIPSPKIMVERKTKYCISPNITTMTLNVHQLNSLIKDRLSTWV